MTPKHRALLEATQTAEASFNASTVTTNVSDYRRSHVLYEFPSQAIFRTAIQGMCDTVADGLGVSSGTFRDGRFTVNGWIRTKPVHRTE